MNILIVEDNTVSRLLLQQQLAVFDHQSREAGSLAEALLLLAAEPFDLVLLDCHLPDGSGAFLIYRILDKLDDCPPIIAISADFDGQRDQLLDAGALAVWSKPISADQLKSISRFLSHADSTQSAASNAGESNAERGLGGLRELARLAGVEAVEALINSFVDTSESRLDSLREAADGRDFRELGRICHSWRGIAASLGATQLNDSLIRCEHAARSENLEGCEQQMLTITAEFDITRDQLVRFCHSLNDQGNKL